MQVNNRVCRGNIGAVLGPKRAVCNPHVAVRRGDSHLVQVRVGGKLRQTGNTRFPTKATDSRAANHLGRIERIGQRDAHSIRNALNRRGFAASQRVERRVQVIGRFLQGRWRQMRVIEPELPE